MTCRCAPALLKLREQVDERWPGRDKSSDGCCGDPAHAARKSDHNPDIHGYAHAIDIDEDIAPGLGSAPLLGLVVLLLADSRTKYVIYEKTISYPGGTSKPYTGANAHQHHLHLSIKPDSTHDTRPWKIGPTKEDDMTPEEHSWLASVNAEVGKIRADRVDDRTKRLDEILRLVQSIDNRVATLEAAGQ